MELPRPCPLLDNSSVPQRRSKYSPFFANRFLHFFIAQACNFCQNSLGNGGQINSTSIAHP
ncbi:MAG: hypothetical protein DU429_02515 [Candidatus Tokpelaia sp.]|nr:MAG: hypothetical protein DU430_05265 [Candidatus Tokpelaia sp.]KAA6207354.1 MAG: hypothetical protein DU429_02515 [Candidatus Tokpelaia sp.]